MRKRIIVLLIVIMLLIPIGVFASNEFIGNDGSLRLSMNKEDTNITTSEDYTHRYNESYFNPEVFSTDVEKATIWFNLKDRGIKVSRIELIQDGNVLARTHDVDSFSIVGEYFGYDFDFISSFKSKETNYIDVVFYLGSEEVHRLKDYQVKVHSEPVVIEIYSNSVGTLTPKFDVNAKLLNLNKDDDLEVYIVDGKGNRLTKLDGKKMKDFNSDEKASEYLFKLSLLEGVSLKEYEDYSFIVLVNGEKIKIEDYNKIYPTSYPSIISFSEPKMPKLKYELAGFNLVNNGPYEVVIKQKGQATKVINNVNAKFNEESYKEEIKIDLKPEYFSNYGEMFSVHLISKNGIELGLRDFLYPEDDIKEMGKDEVDQFEGFKVWNKIEDIEPNKTWIIEFNQPLDESSINKENAYVINKKTGSSIDVDYSYESNNTSLKISPLNDKFKAKENYLLILEKRIKSRSGKNLKTPNVIEFKVN